MLGCLTRLTFGGSGLSNISSGSIGSLSILGI